MYWYSGFRSNPQADARGYNPVRFGDQRSGQDCSELRLDSRKDYHLEKKPFRMLNHVHPGRFLRTEIIEAHGLSVTEAARILRVSRPTLSSLLNAKSDLSGEMALRFEKAFSVDMETLMRMQNSYDIAHTRTLEKKIRVERYVPHPAA